MARYRPQFSENKPLQRCPVDLLSKRALSSTGQAVLIVFMRLGVRGLTLYFVKIIGGDKLRFLGCGIFPPLFYALISAHLMSLTITGNLH